MASLIIYLSLPVPQLTLSLRGRKISKITAELKGCRQVYSLRGTLNHINARTQFVVSGFYSKV